VAFKSGGADCAENTAVAAKHPSLGGERLTQAPLPLLNIVIQRVFTMHLEPIFEQVSAEVVVEDSDCDPRRSPCVGTAATRSRYTATIDWGSVLCDYYALACHVIRRRMPPCLRAMYDPEDFVADAIVEVLKKPARFVEYGPGVIVLVAKRRMINALRSPRNRAARLDVDLMDRQPSVALRLEASELREFMIGRTRDLADRAMLALRCQGRTSIEIAELNGLGLRTVQRFFKEFAEANEPY
jgi:DNA-directed RNA polymerase specialized sigma24 family protein